MHYEFMVDNSDSVTLKMEGEVERITLSNTVVHCTFLLMYKVFRVL